MIAGRADLGEVDHFFPHALEGTGIAEPVDGVWNLVLARSNWFLNRTYHRARLMLNASWQARLEGRPIF